MGHWVGDRRPDEYWEDAAMGSDSCRDERFLKIEFEAIKVHKYYLSEKAGYDVGMDRAIADWLKNHAAAWRRERLKRDLREQIKEIEKYKWIESEKAGRDLGDQAIIEWVQKHAAQWRMCREEQDDDE